MLRDTQDRAADVPARPADASAPDAQPSDTTAPVAKNAAPAKTTLLPAEHHFYHPSVGDVKISRNKKENNQDSIIFNITMNGEENRFIKDIKVLDNDENHGDASTVGYSDIGFPGNMQGKGMIYLFHYALADAAKCLGVEKVAVDSVVNPALIHVCDKSGMEETDANCFSGNAHTVMEACQLAITGKNWQSRSGEGAAPLRAK